MATTADTRALPEPTDLLLVQRGGTPYKATADAVKAYMLTPATAAAIGAIKPGTNLSVDADGTLHAAISGALTYRGPIDPTSAEAPATAAVGDVHLASAGGTALGSWIGITGQPIAQGDLLLFDGSSWSANAALGPDGAGVIRIQVAAPLSVDESDPAQPLLSVALATPDAAGVVQLASALALDDGTPGRVVDAAQLQAAMATAQPAGDYMPLDISSCLLCPDDAPSKRPAGNHSPCWAPGRHLSAASCGAGGAARPAAGAGDQRLALVDHSLCGGQQLAGRLLVARAAAVRLRGQHRQQQPGDDLQRWHSLERPARGRRSELGGALLGS